MSTNNQILEDPLFIMLYTVATAMAAMASIYLLFRRGNAFAADITTPLRLRRWTAVFFAVIALGHFWYIPVVLTSSEAVMMCMLIGGLLDCMLVIPLALVVMLCMLQDRRRPLWPVCVIVAPLVAGVMACIITRSDALLPWLRGYFLLASICFTIYMVHEVRRYGRWLRDNYADLENKEVWQSLLVLAAIMIMIGYYVVGGWNMTYEYIVQVSDLVLIGYLLWRVETLSSLTPDPSPSGEGSDNPVSDDSVLEVTTPLAHREGQGESLPYEKIGTLLQQRCLDTRLYLQHDLTVAQLAQTLGTNRTYLGQYFSRQNTTYNAYINDLRIRHFVSLYREAVAAGVPFTVQQLASDSGYRSYSTFSLAVKQRMGQSVTAWMRDSAS